MHVIDVRFDQLTSNSYDCWSVDPDAQHFLKVTEVIDVRLDVYHSIH